MNPVGINLCEKYKFYIGRIREEKRVYKVWIGEDYQVNLLVKSLIHTKPQKNVQHPLMPTYTKAQIIKPKKYPMPKIFNMVQEIK